MSSDGLVSTSNSDEPDEDEAGLHVGNWGCSIAQGGWVHGQSGLTGIWASSDMETFSVWSGEVSIGFFICNITKADVSTRYSSIWYRTQTFGSHQYTLESEHG